jgi:hypothetical protein
MVADGGNWKFSGAEFGKSPGPLIWYLFTA